MKETKQAKEERAFINWEGIIIKEDEKNRINHGSVYWVFLVPILLPLMLWVASLIIDKAGWLKGMFLISFPLLVLGMVVNIKSKERKLGILVGGVITFLIGLSVFSLFPEGVLF